MLVEIFSERLDSFVALVRFGRPIVSQVLQDPFHAYCNGARRKLIYKLLDHRVVMTHSEDRVTVLCPQALDVNFQERVYLYQMADDAFSMPRSSSCRVADVQGS